MIGPDFSMPNNFESPEATVGISIIIPTFNEEKYIARLLGYLKEMTPQAEVIVADGGSTDATREIASESGAVLVKCPQKGRAAQMNLGASFANNKILYFVHADTLPPGDFYNKIQRSVSKGFSLGRFRTKFDSKNPLLKLNAFLTRFDWYICSGGDQTLFITSKAFETVEGFKEELLLMEDYDIVKRARQSFLYCIMNDNVLISARKYDNNSWLKVQMAHYRIIKMYQSGVQQKVLVEKYKKLLQYRY
ncbi:MAG: TIGR04283 family arsenosugar biosynthesis glycosyltransferase [Ginsengibacter sp.]